MNFNFYALLAAAFSSLVIGFIWYNPKVFGTVWMREAKLNEDQVKGGNMVITLLASFVYAFFIAFIIQFLVIHQFGADGMIGGNVAAAKPSYAAFMADYGTAFRTFKHGALHGFMTGLFFVLPTIGINSLYEKRSFKYVLVVGGYWAITCLVMGGIICSMR